MKKAMGRLGAVVGWRTTVSQKEFEPRVARYSEFLRKAKNMDLAFFFLHGISQFLKAFLSQAKYLLDLRWNQTQALSR